MLPTLLLTALVARPVALTVTVEGSIEASLSSLPPHAASALGAQVARLLRWRGDVARDVKRGDRLAVLYEPTAEPELIALCYRGEVLGLSAYGFTGEDGVLRYWDESGRLVEPTVTNGPLARYAQITEGVQQGRGKRPHAGLDFKAEAGTPVRLPFAGKVSRVNWSRRTNGNCVEVALLDGRALRFLHLATVDPGAVPGAALAAGAPVGTVGTTGRSNAPHLHYEVRAPSGEPLDPLTVHGTGEQRLTDALLAAFHIVRLAHDRELDAGTSTTRGGH